MLWTEDSSLLGALQPCIAAVRTAIRSFVVWKDLWTEHTVRNAVFPLAREFGRLLRSAPFSMLAGTHSECMGCLEQLNGMLMVHSHPAELGDILEGACLRVALSAAMQDDLKSRVWGVNIIQQLCRMSL